MNKAQLIAEIAEAAGITNNDAKKMLNTTLDILVREIAAGNEVRLTGFGKFYLKTIPARKGSALCRATSRMKARRKRNTPSKAQRSNNATGPGKPALFIGAL